MVSRAFRSVWSACIGLLVLTVSLPAQELTRSVAAQRVELLQVQQCLVQLDVATIPEAPSPDRDEAVQILRETKNRMYEQLVVLERQLSLVQELAPTADAMRESRLIERLLYTRGTVEDWTDGSELRIEALIQRDLADLRRELAPDARPVECVTVA
jgi:hypothetical protein